MDLDLDWDRDLDWNLNGSLVGGRLGRLGWGTGQPLLQPRQGPVLGLFGACRFAQGAAKALVSVPARHQHHQAAIAGMDELNLELHGGGVVPGLGQGFLECLLRLCCRTHGSAGDPHDHPPH